MVPLYEFVTNSAKKEVLKGVLQEVADSWGGDRFHLSALPVVLRTRAALRTNSWQRQMW